MGAAGIEVEQFVNRNSVEWAFGRAVEAQRRREQHIADVGMRAARARDPRLLLVLEKATEVLVKMEEEQVGRTRRTASRFADTVELTEVALWRKAYEFCDKGDPLRQLEWIYGAAALLAGFAL
jgi:hypothetical protein